MELEHIYHALKDRLGLIAGITLGLAAFVLLASLVIPKTYEAKTTIVLNHKRYDPVTGTAAPSQLLTGYIDTQLDLIKSKALALRVIDNLGLMKQASYLDSLGVAVTGDGALDRERLAEAMLKKVEIESGRESSVLTLKYRARDPVMASDIANELSKALQQTNLEMKVIPLRTAAASFEEQLKSRRGQLEEARQRLSDYRKSNRLTASNSDVDVELARLAAISSEIADVENQLLDASSKQQNAARGRIENLPIIISDKLVQEMRAELARSDAKLASLGTDMTPEHPRYLALTAENERLRKALADHMNSIVQGIVNQARILAQRQKDLRDAYAQQMESVLRMNGARDELVVLVNDFDNARRTHEAVVQRLAQLRLESDSSRSDVSILYGSNPPHAHASPRIFFNTLIAMMAGLLLGCGLAIFQEARNRRVRSVSDIVDLLGINAMGSVQWSGERRRVPLRHRRYLLTPAHGS